MEGAGFQSLIPCSGGFKKKPRGVFGELARVFPLLGVINIPIFQVGVVFFRVSLPL